MEAKKREKALCRFREGHNLTDAINFDLTYAVRCSSVMQVEAGMKTLVNSEIFL